jgi:hypothetical protein
VDLYKGGYMTPEEIKDMADPEAIVWDDFDDAIVGVDPMGRIVYDINKMIDVLVQDDMTEEEAQEYLDFNVLSTHVGDLTPIHVYIY